MIAVLTVLWLILLPVIRIPEQDAFTLRQFLFAAILCFFWLSRKDKPARKPWVHLELCLGLWVCSRCLSLFLQPPYFSYGLPTLLWEILLGLGFLHYWRWPISQNLLQAGIRGLLVSMSCMALFQLFGLDLFPVLQERLNAGFFHPNFLGIYAVACLAYEWQTQKISRLPLLMALPTVFCVLYSSSRTAAILLFLLVIAQLRRKDTRFFLFLLLLFAAGAIWFYFFPLNKSPMEEFRYQTTPTTAIRLAVLKTELLALKNYPLGMGAGIHAYGIHRFASEDLQFWFPNPEKHSLFRAHCAPLEFIVESGWHMLALIFWFLFLLKRSKPSKSRSALFILLLASLVDVHLNYPTSQALFILFLAHLSPPENTPTSMQSLHHRCEEKLLNPISSWVFAPLFFLAFTNMQIQQKEYQMLREGMRRKTTATARVEKSIHQNLMPDKALIEYAALQYFVELGETERATALGTRLIRLFPGWALVEYWQAGALSLAHEYDEALRLLERALDFHPYEEKLWLAKAEIYEKLGDTPARQESLEHARNLSFRNTTFREKYLNSETEGK